MLTSTMEERRRNIMPDDTKIVEDYTKDILKEKQKVEDQSEQILKIISLDQLIKNPRSYLKKLSTDYFKSNKKHIQKGIKIGKRKADRIVKNNVV